MWINLIQKIWIKRGIKGTLHEIKIYFYFFTLEKFKLDWNLNFLNHPFITILQYMHLSPTLIPSLILSLYNSTTDKKKLKTMKFLQKQQKIFQKKKRNPETLLASLLRNFET